MGPLSSHGQAATMTQAAVRADVHQALDVHLNPLAQIALDLALAFDDGADPTKILLSQFAHAGIGVDIRFLQDRS